MQWLDDRAIFSSFDWLISKLKKVATNRSGNALVIFALAAPVTVMVMGFSVDYGVATVQKNRLQSAADAGAIAAAKSINLADAEDTTLQAIAKTVVTANLDKSAPPPELTIAVSINDGTVNLKAVQPVKTFFGGVYGNLFKTVTVETEAVVVGSTRICVLALDTSKAAAISLEQSARITGIGCAVYSNSTNSSSIKTKNSASLITSLTCSAGGYSGADGNYTPRPITDCPPFPDPLAERPEPSMGGCIATDLVLVDKIQTLTPGVYCGGILIQGTSEITFEPGVYEMRDGPLNVEGNSTVSGENVGFYLTGDSSNFIFNADTSIELTAPKDGEMAGLLFFESRDKTVKSTYEIRSNNARILLGTIYLSTGKLIVDANSPIADQSAYTAIVVQGLKLFSGPNLILNTNYGATDIPVPAGIKGVGNKVALKK